MLCCFQLFATPWTAARQAPLSRGLLQARILEWVAKPSSGGSSQPRDRTQVSHIVDSLQTETPANQTRVSWNASGFFTSWEPGNVHIKQ